MKHAVGQHALTWILALAACTGTPDSDGDGAGTTDTATTDAGNTDAGNTDAGNTDGGNTAAGGDGGSDADPELPVILSLDAWCYPHTTGVEDFIWQVQAAVDDPQGAVSFAPYFDGITVLQGGSNVAGYPMSCDGAGTCAGSFNESQDGVLCAAADTYTIEVRVLDEDGNWSEPAQVVGRSCPSPDPC